MLAFKDYKLGVVDHAIQIELKEENFHASTMMANQSKRTLDIISRDLDPAVYDQMDFLKAMRKLVLSGRRAKIRILVFEINSIIRRGHRLIDQAAHLSSFIEIRKPANEFKDYSEGLLIADETAYVHRKNANRYEAKINFNDKRQARLLLQDFEEMWETAKPDPNLRRVTI